MCPGLYNAWPAIKLHVLAVQAWYLRYIIELAERAVKFYLFKHRKIKFVHFQDESIAVDLSLPFKASSVSIKLIHNLLFIEALEFAGEVGVE